MICAESGSGTIMAHRFANLSFCGGAVLLVLVASLLVNSATAQDLRSEPRYKVTGFRETRFGMTELEVRNAAKVAFGVDDGDMTEGAISDDGITKLTIHVRAIDSSLGAGRIEYFFGYEQRRLFRIDVVWGLDANPNIGGVVAGAARLQRYFLGFSWANQSVRTGVPLDSRAVLLFSGADGKNGAVSLVIEGIQYRLGPNGTVTLMPEPLSRPKLTISYTDEFNKPDVRNIVQGEF
jgi:hypothetical protein